MANVGDSVVQMVAIDEDTGAVAYELVSGNELGKYRWVLRQRMNLLLSVCLQPNRRRLHMMKFTPVDSRNSIPVCSVQNISMLPRSDSCCFSTITGYFRISSLTGWIYVNKPLDRETVAQYRLGVRASNLVQKKRRKRRRRQGRAWS